MNAGVRSAAFALAILLSIPLAPAAAQTLLVPLTGARHREIEPATLFHTLFSDFVLEDDATTYVQTGDIPAMWLRDSSAQTIPYVRFAADFQALGERTAGVIQRQAREILVDPYAEAFTEDYGIYERKWEVDSLAWPVILASVYWRTTHDASIFTPELHRAFRQIVATYRCEERHATCSTYRSIYRTFTRNAYNPNTGLIWGAFRPSDDAVRYRFNIPQNAFAAIALQALATMANEHYHDGALAASAMALSEHVQAGILRYGIVYRADLGGWLYAYEVDGLGNALMMDDANIPNLLTLPYIGWCSAYDPKYLVTRAFVLSAKNPYYYRGTYASGLGSPHTPPEYVWPLGIIGRALTSTSSLEIATAITTLAQTDSEAGLIHESFYASGYWAYTRSDFGWANALYAELLFRTLAGDRATPFVQPEVMLPFETRTDTPHSVRLVAQFENDGQILNALEGLLQEP